MLPLGDFFTQTDVMVPTAITVSPRTTVNSYSIERVFCRGEHVASRCFYQALTLERVGPNPEAAMVFVRKPNKSMAYGVGRSPL
jgi:hypothetical protein